jgi:predicted nucleic acid-binding protein
MRDGAVQWVSSEALVEEIASNPRVERRLQNTALLTLAAETVSVTDPVAVRARQLEAAGYGPFDALHLACAESAGVDVLLTTDDGFIRRVRRGDGFPRIPALNPLSWSQEEQP